MSLEYEQQKREELVTVLESMGFAKSFSRKAAEAVDPTQQNATELCMHWMEENPMSDTDEEDHVNDLLAQLYEMGFAREKAKEALTECGEDVQRAILYLLNDSSKRLQELQDEPMDTADVTPGGPDETGEQKAPTPQKPKKERRPSVKKESEISILTEQIISLQDMVLNYQNKYLALKRQTLKAEKKPEPIPEKRKEEESSSEEDEMFMSSRERRLRLKKQREAKAAAAAHAQGLMVPEDPPPPPHSPEETPPPSPPAPEEEVIPCEIASCGMKVPFSEYSEHMMAHREEMEAKERVQSEPEAEAHSEPEELPPPPPVEELPRPPTHRLDRALSHDSHYAKNRMMAKRRARLLARHPSLKGVSREKQLVHLLKNEEKPEVVENAKEKSLADWIHDGGFKSLKIDIVEAIEVGPKIVKKFYCVVRVDSSSVKTKMQKKEMCERWKDHFEFPLRGTTQNISITIFGTHEEGFIGRSFISLERLRKPLDIDWHPLVELRPSPLAVFMEARAQVNSELQLRIEFSTDDPKSNSDHIKMKEDKPKNYVAEGMRNKVANQRYQQNGFDLDLSYITDRIIAMAYPAQKVEGVYRHKMRDVRRFFKKRHDQAFRVYNLCSERDYNASKLDNRVVRFPCNEESPMPLKQIIAFCHDADAFLSKDDRNVVAVHCVDGNGRTGFLVACYLLHAKICGNNAEAVKLFAQKRTTDGRLLVVPSQFRYIRYYNLYTNGPGPGSKAQGEVNMDRIRAKEPNHLQLLEVRIHDIPFKCKPRDVKVWYRATLPETPKWKYSSRKSTKPRRYRFKDGTDAIVFSTPEKDRPVLYEDVKVDFFYSTTFRKQKMFSFCFNTRFIAYPDGAEKCRLVLKKRGVDKAHKDKRHKLYPENMYIELVFTPVD